MNPCHIVSIPSVLEAVLIYCRNEMRMMNDWVEMSDKIIDHDNLDDSRSPVFVTFCVSGAHLYLRVCLCACLCVCVRRVREQTQISPVYCHGFDYR